MSEKYKNWTKVWGSNRKEEDAAAQRYADILGKKPDAAEVVEEYPDWAKDYHSIYDTTSNKLVVNPEVVNDAFATKLWDEGGSWDTLQALAEEAPSGKDILEAGIDILSLLLKKNISYGDSALSPLRLFSKADVEEQLLVRIDDKLSRLKNNQKFLGDNDIDDLIGYLILLKVVRRRSNG